MVTVGMNYRVREGKNEAFVEGFRGVLDVMRGIDGHTKSNLYVDTNDSQEYLIVSEWSAMEAFQGFIRSQAFKDATAWGSAEILDGRPQHKVYGAKEDLAAH